MNRFEHFPADSGRNLLEIEISLFTYNSKSYFQSLFQLKFGLKIHKIVELEDGIIFTNN